jgi:predicted transcriptional regulator
MDFIGVRVPEELKTHFERLASDHRRTLSDVVRMALEDAANGSRPNADENEQLDRIEALLAQCVTLQQLRAELRRVAVIGAPEQAAASEDDGLDFSGFEL